MPFITAPQNKKSALEASLESLTRRRLLLEADMCTLRTAVTRAKMSVQEAVTVEQEEEVVVGRRRRWFEEGEGETLADLLKAKRELQRVVTNIKEIEWELLKLRWAN